MRQFVLNYYKTTSFSFNVKLRRYRFYEDMHFVRVCVSVYKNTQILLNTIGNFKLSRTQLSLVHNTTETVNQMLYNLNKMNIGEKGG